MAIDARIQEENSAEDRKRAELFAYRDRLAYTSLPEREWSITFENLKQTAPNRIIVERLLKWDPQKMSKGVFLHGTVGTGKSTLAKALINRWASLSYRCKFISVTDALKNIREAIGAEDTSVRDECNHLIEPSLLILDDLGVDNVSEWAREQIFSILEARFHSGKHTCFTSNMAPADIVKTYKERIADRLLEYCSWLPMNGESYRRLNYVSEI